MKTLTEVLADAEGRSPTEVALELTAAIEAEEEPFSQGDLITVLDEYVTDVAHMLMNMVLDLAGSIGALPDGRDGARAEMEESLAFIKTCAIYTAVAKRANASG